MRRETNPDEPAPHFVLRMAHCPASLAGCLHYLPGSYAVRGTPVYLLRTVLSAGRQTDHLHCRLLARATPYE
jgi:hypothetical protein